MATASVPGLSKTVTWSLTVLPAPLTVTVGFGERYYGWANPTFPVRIVGLVGSDTVVVTPQTTATPASLPGLYPVTATVSGPDAVNYAITVQNNSLKVTKAPLLVQAKNVGTTYGSTPPLPTAYFIVGFANGDTAATAITGAPVLTSTVTSASPVGFYPIGVQPGTLAAANYFFDMFGNGEGSVVVFKGQLFAAPDNLIMHQGGPVPPLTYKVTGFVNGETAASALTGAPVLSTAASSASPPGHYFIFMTPGTFAAKNYYIHLANGVMTVVP